MLITKDTSLSNFEFWGGAKDRASLLTDDQLNIVEEYLEECYPDGMSETLVNDIFWFEFDWVCQMLGYENEEELEDYINNN